MKDAKGHGSAAHQNGVGQVGQTVPDRIVPNHSIPDLAKRIEVRNDPSTGSIKPWEVWLHYQFGSRRLSSHKTQSSAEKRADQSLASAKWALSPEALEYARQAAARLKGRS